MNAWKQTFLSISSIYCWTCDIYDVFGEILDKNFFEPEVSLELKEKQAQPF